MLYLIALKEVKVAELEEKILEEIVTFYQDYAIDSESIKSNHPSLSFWDAKEMDAVLSSTLSSLPAHT